MKEAKPENRRDIIIKNLMQAESIMTAFVFYIK